MIGLITGKSVKLRDKLRIWTIGASLRADLTNRPTDSTSLTSSSLHTRKNLEQQSRSHIFGEKYTVYFNSDKLLNSGRNFTDFTVNTHSFYKHTLFFAQFGKTDNDSY